jgi:uncharacterized repeat protein (TIGR02543 family)
MKKALSLILCLLMLIGAFSSVSLAAGAAKDESAPVGTAENPYVVGSYYQLRNYAKEYRDRGEVVYVKLAADLTYRGTEGELVTNGADVVIDLAGYTISVETERLDYMMYGKTGKFIIRDSGRYDLDKGQTVGGRIEYEYKKYIDDGWITFFSVSNMLSGDFVIEGGTLVNKNYKDTRIDSVYKGDSLVMTGGTLEGCYPIRFYNEAGKSRISGGTLKTKLGAGIKVDKMESSKLFTVEGVTMINATGKAKAVAFEADFAEGYAASHTGAQAITYWNGILADNTYAYIDGARQQKGVSGAYYDGDGGILGPAFTDTYELVSPTAVDTLNLTIKEPKAGETLPYNVTIPTDSAYKIVTYNRDNEWKNGVEWTRGDDYNTPYPIGTRFDGDKSYTVFIKVGLNDMKHTDFADPGDITATVNGRTAKVYNSSAYEMTVYCTFNVEMNKISEIALTLTAPKRGAHPSFNAAVPADSLYRVQTSNSTDGFINGVSWTDVDNHLTAMTAGDSFNIGSYTVLIMVEANDPDYTRFADYTEVTAAINGESAIVIPYSSTRYGVAYNYELSDRIKSVAITIDEPLPDENPSYDVTLPDDALYTVNIYDEDDPYSRNGVLWEEGKYVFSPSYTFVEGNDYTVSVTLEPIDKDNYRFADSNAFIATVNGNKASYRFYEGLCIVSYTFTVPVYCDVWFYNDPEADDPMSGTDLPRGTILGPVDAMTRAGYEFAGWYTDRACTEPYDPTQPIMEDTSLFPKWVKKEVILLGDADGDGKVTIVDATCIQRRLASLSTANFIEQAADTDEDGKTTIIDATYIQRWLAGLKSNDNIGLPVA